MKELVVNKTGEQKYRVLIDNAPEPVFIFDVETFKFLDFNKNAVHFFNIPKESLYDLTPLDLSPETMFGQDTSTVGIKYIQEALQGGIHIEVVKRGD